MAKLANGGQAAVKDGHLVVLAPRKTEEDGRAAPVSEEHVVTAIQLEDVDEVKFTKAGRPDYPGALQVMMVDGSEVMLRMYEDQALPLIAALRDDRELSDGDSGGAAEE